jgi:hypothetical protein
VFLWLANWWDSADLWLSQLAFPFQFAIVIAVVAPLCLGIAWAIDRCVDMVSGRTHHAPAKPASVPEMLVRADVPAGTPATIITSEPPARTPAPAGRAPESTGS